MKRIFLFIPLVVCAGVQAEAWKTYHDAKLGIEFQYPPQWSCSWEESGGKSFLILMQGSKNSPYIVFRSNATNPGNLPIEKWYKITQRGKTTAHKGSFAGQPAMIFPSTREGARYCGYEIARPGGTVLAVLSREYPSDPTARPTIEKILRSCKLDKATGQ